MFSIQLICIFFMQIIGSTIIDPKYDESNRSLGNLAVKKQKKIYFQTVTKVLATVGEKKKEHL